MLVTRRSGAAAIPPVGAVHADAAGDWLFGADDEPPPPAAPAGGPSSGAGVAWHAESLPSLAELRALPELPPGTREAGKSLFMGEVKLGDVYAIAGRHLQAICCFHMQVFEGDKGTRTRKCQLWIKLFDCGFAEILKALH